MHLFRIIALIEGVTTLALFLVAMPLKYLAGNPMLVPPIGWVHGIAFIAYMATMVAVFPAIGVPFAGWLRATLAAFVPFGTFVNDRYLKRFDAGHA